MRMQEVVFQRKIYSQMLNWKEESNGKTALLIKGARRVGKSTIVELFARKEYQSYIILDFSKISKEINSLFEDISDLDFFFLRLQLLTNINLLERKSVIIFDEVQLQPLARQAIKHLVKDGRYDYIETGSLLSIKKNIKDILIPSEETRITMFPMDYEEFRWALGDDTTIPLIRMALKQRISLGDSVNRKLMRDFRLYMLVGGMPQAVEEYIRTNNFSRVDQIKRNILELYEDDFRKIDPRGRISLFFKAIPAQLSKNVSRYQVSTVDSNSRSSKVVDLIAEMVDSMTVNISYHANDPNVGMALNKDFSRFKLFLADTGLFVTLAFMDKSFTENIIYEKLLSDKLPANMGYIYENMLAQILQTAGNELYYYTMPTESAKHNYEIDFLLSKAGKICPVEVKASGYKRHTSLDKFIAKYQDRILEKYLVYTKDLKKEGEIWYTPIYMMPFLE
ncbi:ATP-binding protein [Clostridiales bacterium COT073_COT-073]|nr:ATP-binding protein [Clostridiales bacterium COT073_COT-073]